MKQIRRARGTEPFLRSVKRLGRKLPLLGGLCGLPAICAGTVAVANHATRQLSAGGGEVTLVVFTPLRELTVAWVKVGLLVQQMVSFIGL